MTHYTTPDFWKCYNALPEDARKLADKAYSLLKDDPRHPSLHFKKVDEFWSARITDYYRALAVEADGDLLWFWIGTHAEYDKILA